MTIEEAEIVFGKRWNKWTDGEILEFVGALTAEELSPPIVPGVLKMAFDHQDALRGGARDVMQSYLPPHLREGSEWSDKSNP